MKKYYILILVILVLLWSCANEINITQPVIVLNPSDNYSAMDTLKLSVIENAEIDGNIQIPDYYEWSILDESQNTVYSDFVNSKDITWVPDSAGYFLIQVKIGYDGNKSISTIREVTITESVNSLQKRMVGSWTGSVTCMYGQTWDIDVTFDSIGHFIATGYNYSVSVDEVYGPFRASYYSIYGAENPGIPSAELPCYQFIITNIVDNRGSGYLITGHEYEIPGSSYWYECYQGPNFNSLTFTDNFNQLSFQIEDIGYMNYNLVRIQ